MGQTHGEELTLINTGKKAPFLRISRSFCMPALLLLVVFAEVQAQSAGQAGAFLRIGLGPRARAMGDAYSAVPEKSVIPFYNPAGLGFIRYREASVSSSVLSFDRRFNYAGLVSPLPPTAGYGLGIIQSGFGNSDARSSNGEKTGGTIEDVQYAVFMGFAIRFTDKFAAGITPTWLYSKVFDVSSTSLGAGLGAMYTPVRGLFIGYSVHHLFHDFSYVRDPTGQGDQTTQDRLPRVTRYGVSYSYDVQKAVKRVLLSIDVESIRGQGDRLHIGSEVNLLDQLMVRVGLDHKDFTAGVGVPFQWKEHRFYFDYSFVHDSRGGLQFGSQDFALSYRF